MENKKPIRCLLLALVIGLITAACSSGDTTDTTMHMDDGHTHFSFGEPALAVEATHVIEISANDDFRFDPEAIIVTAGDVVKFKVTNDGKITHDFVLGDAAVQDQHEEDMMNMTDDDSMSHEEPNAFAIDPGETKEMTWRMTMTGEILIGCHQPGHYVSGMKGTVKIES